MSVNDSNHIRHFYVLDRSFLDEGEDSEMDMMMAVQITNGMIKGFHEFGIKLPVGCRVNVEREDSSVAKDEYALLCKVPQDLDEETKGTVMRSKSKRKEYRVSDVMGKTIGRVQYFLNKTFIQLLEEGKVKSVNGCITGEPTASRKPPTTQKWQRNRQAGGGAVIPCSWILQVSRGMEQRVKEIVESRLPDIEGHKNMEVKILHSAKRKFHGTVNL